MLICVCNLDFYSDHSQAAFLCLCDCCIPLSVFLGAGLAMMDESVARAGDIEVDEQILQHGQLHLADPPLWLSRGQITARGACCVWMLLKRGRPRFARLVAAHFTGRRSTLAPRLNAASPEQDVRVEMLWTENLLEVGAQLLPLSSLNPLCPPHLASVCVDSIVTAFLTALFCHRNSGTSKTQLSLLCRL